MKVIALTGSENTGKSHTINITYCFLLGNSYVQIPGHFRILGKPDFEDVFDILQKDGKKVGIIGMGDYIKGDGSLKKLLAEMQGHGCDFVICACRDNPKIEAAVRAYPSHIFVAKTPSTGRENDRIVNTQDAISLITHL
ncbi:MAG: hypothetical protein J0G98_08180 [Terrimonas ferruginea]|uniref:hypothetical protein n=1 Tax=Terrimonas ferruginea TaxID=249 RepID=UPI0009278DFC|nr:hypothetical protein [Terrimonas ferruginea]MBN8783026.1 hypothetical protein [Terrimonas ferruginea]OJW44205.1 MAG: hypothetical protein BGO56_20185 [Sphingobacteriales bacterium 48-107]